MVLCPCLFFHDSIYENCAVICVNFHGGSYYCVVLKSGTVFYAFTKFTYILHNYYHNVIEQQVNFLIHYEATKSIVCTIGYATSVPRFSPFLLCIPGILPFTLEPRPPYMFYCIFFSFVNTHHLYSSVMGKVLLHLQQLHYQGILHTLKSKNLHAILHSLLSLTINALSATLSPACIAFHEPIVQSAVECVTTEILPTKL